jgi:hypothetical protein
MFFEVNNKDVNEIITEWEQSLSMVSAVERFYCAVHKSCSIASRHPYFYIRLRRQRHNVHCSGSVGTRQISTRATRVWSRPLTFLGVFFLSGVQISFIKNLTTFLFINVNRYTNNNQKILQNDYTVWI